MFPYITCATPGYHKHVRGHVTCGILIFCLFLTHFKETAESELTQKMSFVGYKEKVENGDTVIIFLGFENMLTFKVHRQAVHQTRYGVLRHDQLIGKRYGSKIQCSMGWCYVLHPTPELWTPILPHRTQILYATDISMITFQLDLKPGSIAIEAGNTSLINLPSVCAIVNKLCIVMTSFS